MHLQLDREAKDIRHDKRANPLKGITLSNGHVLRWLAASGALKFNGRGWGHEQILHWILFILTLGFYRMIDTRDITVVAKTITLNPIIGNYRWWWPLRCIWPIFDGWKLWRVIGMVNKVGLSNPGLGMFIQKVGRKRRPRQKLIVSVYGTKPDILACLKKIDAECIDIAAFELNLSCPNMGKGAEQDAEQMADDITEYANATKLPVLGKFGADMPYLQVAKILSRRKELNPRGKHLEGISFNTVPWNIVFPGKRSPLHKLEARLAAEAKANNKGYVSNGGGVSGKPAQKFNWKAMQELIDCPLNTIPVIGGSMWSYDDTARLIAMRCGAIGFGSIYIPKPWAPSRWSKKWDKRHAE
jgi:dihydroorotate dehydrogenase